MNKKNWIFLGLLTVSALAGKAQMIITGYMANPDGADGNYEYVQLMATENIDFAKANYSLITYYASTAATYPEQGWAAGGDVTYKFELTSGTVKKGDVFYVGGSKKINGAKSSSISSAKWIRNIAYKTKTADGSMGNNRAGLFTNSGNANGIAVFSGIVVGPKTVPLDVVFFGALTGPYYQASPELGYRISDNDLYTIAKGEFFGKGANTATFAHAGEKNFAKLGGIYNSATKKWTQERKLTKTKLTNESQLADIEIGDGITKIEN